MATYYFFAENFHYTPQQTDLLDVEIIQAFPLIKQLANRKAEEEASRLARR